MTRICKEWLVALAVCGCAGQTARPAQLPAPDTRFDDAAAVQRVYGHMCGGDTLRLSVCDFEASWSDRVEVAEARQVLIAEDSESVVLATFTHIDGEWRMAPSEMADDFRATVADLNRWNWGEDQIDNLQYLEDTKSALRWLAAHEEGYFADELTYTTDVDALEYVPSEGISVTVHYATSLGWLATATHASLQGVKCELYYGDVPLKAPEDEGLVRCR